MYNNERAMEPVQFMKMLKLTGDFFGQDFVLQKWQVDVIKAVYGTVKDNGYRQYQYAYLEIPKKNGKTTMVGGLALYHLVCDPFGGEIYCCAAEKSQASLTYQAAKQMVEQNKYLAKILKVTDSQKKIENKNTGTILKVLSAEAYSKHGINPTVVIFDELHAQPNRELWDVMTFGAGSARKEPLWWVITTAGDDPDKKSIGWEIHEKAQKIISGEMDNPLWYCRIYGASVDADIYDEEVWRQVNPSLGYTIPIETLRLEAMEAKESESREKLFRWLRLNQWVSLKRLGWLPLPLWDDTVGTWNARDMIGRSCYLGLDLSSTTDLTAVVLLFPPQKEITDWRCLFYVFVPEENMKERIRRDKVPYDRWQNEGLLTVTEGNAVDYDVVQSCIEQIAKQYKVKWLCADKWNSQMMTQALAKKGIRTIEIAQTMDGMSPAMKELERKFRNHEISHLENDLVRWTFGNVVVATDGNENIKPMKNRSFERIDPIVALICAMAGAIKLEKKVSAYEDRGIRMV